MSSALQKQSAISLEEVIQAAEQAAAPDDLQQAFTLFNQMSEQLTDSYSLLEDRVSELTRELHQESARRMAELAEKEQIANRLQTLLKVLPGGVVVLDAQGRIRDANPAAAGMLGEPLEGELWRDVIVRCFAPRRDDGHEVSTRDGRRISIATRSLDDEGRFEGQIILLTDQTETRRMQSELSRHERLSALGKMVSALAHQIRTPLSAAMLYAGHLCEGKLNPDQQHKFSEKLLKRLNHMERQVQDMLMFVKGEIPLTDAITVAELQQTLIEEMEVALASSGSVCRWDNQCPNHLLRCNQDILVSAMLNLVNNAIQAVGSRAQLDITLQLAASGTEVVIGIHDQGPGIPADLMETVTDIFMTTKPQGTGLGLAVVNSVIKGHGGRFELASTAGEGTTATLILPLAQQTHFSRDHQE